jgi:hypothetical protein
MSIINDEVFENMSRLNISGKKLGVEWSSIIEFCEQKESIGKSNKDISNELTKAIIATQNKYFETKQKKTEKKTEKKSVEKDEKVTTLTLSQKMIDDGDEMWKVHQKYPDDFKSYNFSIYDMIGGMDETKSKDIMSLVIGRGGCFFKKWTNYWHIGKIYYDKYSMTISIFIHKNEKSKRNKGKIIKGFIINNIQANIDKYEFVKRMQQQTKTN